MINKNCNNKIVVTVPEILYTLGLIISIMCSLLMIYFIFAATESLPIGFYIFYGLFISIGIFAAILQKRWKVIVKKDVITIYPFIGSKYSFCHTDIISIIRQVKKNRVKSERIIIKLVNKRKIIVESSHIGYEKLLKYLLSVTTSDIRVGFGNFK